MSDACFPCFIVIVVDGDSLETEVTLTHFLLPRKSFFGNLCCYYFGLFMTTNLQTGATVYVVVFRSDLELAYDKLVDYYFYRSRFRNEFNFRDAKQRWCLEDFMTINPTTVYSSDSLAMLMVNLHSATPYIVKR